LYQINTITSFLIKLPHVWPIIGYREQVRLTRTNHRTVFAESSGPKLVITLAGIKVVFTYHDLSTTAGIEIVKRAVANMSKTRSPDLAPRIMGTQVTFEHI